VVKAISKIVVFSAFLLFLVKCDRYEFPQSPYPKITTLPVTNISETGVTFHASINRLASVPIINHGFVWGTDEEATVSSEYRLQLGPVSAIGEFEADISAGLDKDRTYFVRAFVATSDYYVYGDPVSFVSK
jgi:hypothetical protein